MKLEKEHGDMAFDLVAGARIMLLHQDQYRVVSDLQSVGFPVVLSPGPSRDAFVPAERMDEARKLYRGSPLIRWLKTFFVGKPEAKLHGHVIRFE